jgi:allophanate hydrolase
MLYGSALLAERHAAVGAFLSSHPGEVDPVVAEVVGRGAGIPADDYVRAAQRLLELRVEFARSTAALGLDLVMVPTVPRVPRLAEVHDDPIGVNAGLGRFASGGNLLDLCGVAVPAGSTTDGVPFGITLLGPALADATAVAAAARFVGETAAPDAAPFDEETAAPGRAEARPARLPIAVAGLHLSGQPLNHQLVSRGGRLAATTTTAPAYRLVRLDTDPARPGLVRDEHDGQAIEVEVWELPPDELARFVASVGPPLAVGSLELVDGTWVPGFLALPDGLASARDITASGSWRRAESTRP